MIIPGVTQGEIINFNTRQKSDMPLINKKVHHLTLGEVIEKLVHLLINSKLQTTCPISVNGHGIKEIKIVNDGIAIII